MNVVLKRMDNRTTKVCQLKLASLQPLQRKLAEEGYVPVFFGNKDRAEIGVVVSEKSWNGIVEDHARLTQQLEAALRKLRWLARQNTTVKVATKTVDGNHVIEEIPVANCVADAIAAINAVESGQLGEVL